MGTYGMGPFDNDGAADFMDALQVAPSRSMTKALKAITSVPVGEYIEVDAGGAAFAACELVALSFGYGDASAFDDFIVELVERLKPKEEQRCLALAALPRIADPETSELAELWEEADERPAFDDLLADLRSRLEAASAGVRVVQRPKCGDILYLPNAADSTTGIVLQMISLNEVAVFEGAGHDESAALEVVRSHPARRVPTSVNKFLRRARLAGHAPLRRDLKEKRLYAAESGSIDGYYVIPAGGRHDPLMATYDEARQIEKLAWYDAEGMHAAALGTLPIARVRSPDEREAALRARHSAEWAKRRAITSPGPFGDPAEVQRLIEWAEAYGVDALLRWSGRLAGGLQGYGRPNERSERGPYAFVALVAVWRGTWPTTDLPDTLANRLPPCPDGPLLADATADARVLVEQVLSRDSELRLMWDESPEGGAALRAAIDALRTALL